MRLPDDAPTWSSHGFPRWPRRWRRGESRRRTDGRCTEHTGPPPLGRDGGADHGGEAFTANGSLCRDCRTAAISAVVLAVVISVVAEKAHNRRDQALKAPSCCCGDGGCSLPFATGYTIGQTTASTCSGTGGRAVVPAARHVVEPKCGHFDPLSVS